MREIARTTAIFTKHPRPGEVKTRLSPALTPEQAARLAEAMLADTVARRVAGETELGVTPEESIPWFRARFPEVAAVRAQRGRNLGERLAAYFALEREATRVVVGSDAPHVPAVRIDAAHAALAAGADLVLGPDDGGGYYLVGVRGSHPELFTGVEMSSGGMLAETVALARRRGLAVSLLASDFDVDRFEDLERLARTLAARPRGARQTLRVLGELSIPGRAPLCCAPDEAR